MSTDASSHAGERTVAIDTDGTVDAARWLALGCVLVLTASYVSVLYGVTQVVGGSRSLAAIVGVSLAAATVLAGLIRPRTAAVVAVAGAGAGFAYYLTSAGVELGVVFTATDRLVSDTVALATGLPLLRMVQAGTWTLGFAPAPVFLSWYLAVRGRYVAAVVPGGAALGFLVLTGDAGTPAALAGTLAAVGTVAFGELRRRGGSIAQADLLAVLFAVTVALSLSVSVVPGEPTGPTHLTQGEPGTLEATIDSSPQRSGISGQVDLSPEVRFTVESDEPAYWRTGVYDRFTGDEWIRSGQDERYDGRLSPPPGNGETVSQTVTAETELGIMPVAPQPVELGGEITRRTTVSRHGQPRPETPLQAGESYTVESAVVDPSPAALRAAGTDYPDGISDAYLQTPEDTSSAFGARTDEITASADTPYDEAVAIEDYLESTKEYSLEVSQPSGNVAEGFLLETEAGYCVYFATTMTQMLREEGIPARYVTGYTTGQQVDDDTYVVRGLDAHSWVEAYFPGHGWVRFDPTPSSTRGDVHTDRLRDARANGNEDADTEESADVPIDGADEEPEGEPRDDGVPDPFDGNDTESNGSANVSEPRNDTDPGGNGTNGTDDPEPSFNGTTVDGGDERSWFERLSALARESVALGIVALVGLAAGARRTGAPARLRREVGVYWHGPRRDPDRDAERAFERLERLLARQYRPRRRSESPRAYLRALAEAADEGEPPTDPRLERVLEAHERATYGGGVDREDADAAIAVVDDLARKRLPVIGRRE